MIDPAPWKTELARTAKQLDAYIGRSRLSHSSTCRLERLLMESYYLLHKLMEDHRVDDNLADSMVSVELVPSKGRTSNLIDHQRVFESLAQPVEQVSLRLGVLTNKIIHSYLLLPIIDGDSGLQRVAICSEFEHFDKILIVSLKCLLDSLTERG